MAEVCTLLNDLLVYITVGMASFWHRV